MIGGDRLLYDRLVPAPDDLAQVGEEGEIQALSPEAEAPFAVV